MTSLEALKLELHVSKRVASYSCLEKCKMHKKNSSIPFETFLELHQVSGIFSEKLCSTTTTCNLQQIVTVTKIPPDKKVALHSTTNTLKDYLSNVVNLKMNKKCLPLSLIQTEVQFPSSKHTGSIFPETQGFEETFHDQQKQEAGSLTATA